MRVLVNIPFLRICIPFIIGILIAIQFNLNAVSSLFLILALLIALIPWFLKKQTKLTKTVFLICLDVFLFCFAINLVSAARINTDENYYGNFLLPDKTNKLIVVINDLPIEKQNSSNGKAGFIKCQLTVLKVKKNEDYIHSKGNLIGYFKKTKGETKLQFGQTLVLNTKLIEIDDPKNPLEFDYKNYLKNRQIYHTCFVDSGDYENLNSASPLSFIWTIGLKCKKTILATLKNSALSQEAFSICAALLTGYDDEIDKPVMDAFSHSGTLHVLSVSGLHTGLIYLVLAFMFDLLDRKKKYPIFKFVFITLSLWFFALITGFSAPVLRAVIMFNLLGFGKIFFRNNFRNQINILLVSAFILLCYNPFLITDIGFQLSYFALFGILFFQPVFANIWQPENKILQYIWQSITASFAATLTTLPFTLFYFKQFPIWFFVCNLVVVPATFVILFMAILIIINIGKVTIVINFIVNFLIGFINLFNSPNVGFIDNIDFDWFDAILLSLCIILISVTLYYRSYKYLVYSLVIIILWQINNVFSSFQIKEKKLFAVYQIKKQAAYSFKNKRNVEINEVNKSDFNYHIKPHLISLNYPDLQKEGFNYFELNKLAVLILNRESFWPKVEYKNISTLVISNNFKLTAYDLENFGNLKLLVADGSNNTHVIRHLAKLCGKFGIEFYNTKEKGAYILNL